MENISNALLQSIVDSLHTPESTDFDFSAHSVLDGAIALAKILLRTKTTESRLVYESAHKSDFDKWYDAQDYKRQRAVSVWLQSGSLTNDWQIFKRFNERPEIKEILELFLSQKQIPPYLNLFCLNLIKQIFKLSNDQMATLSSSKEAVLPWYDALFLHKDLLEAWVAENQKKLRFYGGSTNTVLGFYDRIAEKFPVHKTFDAYFDIGGGFSTSDVSRLIGKPFTSLDIRSPLYTDYSEDLIIRKMDDAQRVRCLNNAEMDSYLEAQRGVNWLDFGVNKQQIPPDFNSYFLTSFGFMTSTVKLTKGMERHWCSEKILPDYRPIVTSLVAMYRVIELVAMGKNVQLLSVNRASSRSYAHRVVLLEWNGGKITYFQTNPSKIDRPEILKRIQDALS